MGTAGQDNGRSKTDAIQDKSVQDDIFSNLDLDPEDLGVSNDDFDLGADDSAEDQQARQQVEGDRDDNDGFDDLSSESQQQQQQQDDGRLQFDSKGNVIDKDGKLLARAGSERRLYEKAHNGEIALAAERANHRHTLDRLNQAIQIGVGVAKQLEEAHKKAANPVAQQLGLNDQEQLEAFQLFAEGKKDPVNVLKKLLTRAATRGINLGDLGIQGGNGIDGKALLELVREEIRKGNEPAAEANKRQAEIEQQRKEEQERFDRSRDQVHQYFRDNPAMLQHAPVFKQILEDPRFRGMSLNEIGLRIELNLLRNKQSENPRRRSPPRGRKSLAGNGQDNQPVSPEASWDDIIRSSMTDSGL